MTVNVTEYFNLSILNEHLCKLLGSKKFWVEDNGWLSPLPVLVLSRQTRPLIPVYNSINIEHGNNVENEFSSQLDSSRITAEQEVNTSLERKGALHLARMDPARNNDCSFRLIRFEVVVILLHQRLQLIIVNIVGVFDFMPGISVLN